MWVLNADNGNWMQTITFAEVILHHVLAAKAMMKLHDAV